MAKMFNFLPGKDEYREQPFSLYQLMNGDVDEKDRRFEGGDCYVMGIKFVQEGTLEFEEVLNTKKEKLKKSGFNIEAIDIIIKSETTERGITVQTKFAAMAYPRLWDEHTKHYSGLGGCPYSAFITNFRKLAIIHPDERRIDVVPYDREGHHRSLFYDIGGAKMIGVRWNYEGTMEDALKEFLETHTLNIGKNARTSEEYFKAMEGHTGDHSWNFLVEEENVPLGKVLELIAEGE